MADDVVGKGDVCDLGPGVSAALVARREDNGEGFLICADPAIFKDIVIDGHIPGVLDLEDVLNGHVNAAPCGVIVVPRGALGHVIVGDGDVAGNIVGDRSVAAADDKVFAGGFEEVVVDDVAAGAVEACDGLGIAAAVVDVG